MFIFHAQHLPPPAQLTAISTAVTGTDAIRPWIPISRTGSIDQQRHQHHCRHHLHQPPPPRPQSPATNRKHNHQDSHQLAPQQCLGQGWERIRRRRLCDNTPRSLSRRSGKERQVHVGHRATCLGTAPSAQPAVQETLHVQLVC